MSHAGHVDDPGPDVALTSGGPQQGEQELRQQEVAEMVCSELDQI
jgi:hypothetical protein